ncbi:hypothetical protein EC957_003543 [Mortierella hygrophila]|uniref:WD40 repeat-like protein n=1 Tax=Mortierella hygrophila TaxID=979708 RepID=A0A9P6F323_9FUNG|nr:hypothetical protein EC957_003543 [Mortierella hygrophila]
MQWDSLTGARVPLPIELPEDLSVESVSYSLDNIPTAVVDQDGTLRLWELQEGRRETILEGSGPANWCDTVTLWDLSSTQQKHVLIENGGPTREAIHCLAFSATGHQLAIGTWMSTSTGRPWMSASTDSTWIDTSTDSTSIDTSTDSTSIDASTDSTWIGALPEITVIGAPSGTIWLFDTQSKGLIASKLAHTGMNGISFSPDGQQLAIGSMDRSIYLWGFQSEERAIGLGGHTESVNCVAYSPCGEWIASGSDDKTVRVWRRWRPPGDKESWSCVLTVRGYFNTVRDIAWSPTVPMEFITGCSDESVRVWRVSSDALGK